MNARYLENLRAVLRHHDPFVAAQARASVAASPDPAVRALLPATDNSAARRRQQQSKALAQFPAVLGPAGKSPRAQAPDLQTVPSRAGRAAKSASKQGAHSAVRAGAGKGKADRPGTALDFSHFAAACGTAPILGTQPMRTSARRARADNGDTPDDNLRDRVRTLENRVDDLEDRVDRIETAAPADADQPSASAFRRPMSRAQMLQHMAANPPKFSTPEAASDFVLRAGAKARGRTADDEVADFIINAGKPRGSQAGRR